MMTLHRHTEPCATCEPPVYPCVEGDDVTASHRSVTQSSIRVRARKGEYRGPTPCGIGFRGI
jgi:hypothetical protein